MVNPKISVDDANGTISVTCPRCRSEIDTKQLRNDTCGKTMDLECGYCLYRFKLNLECRKNFRKKTNLEGICSGEHFEYSIVVETLSYKGIGFRLPDASQISIGDTVSVEFLLDDELQSRIRSEVNVKRKLENDVGCEFVRFQGESEEKLDIYLMSDF